MAGADPSSHGILGSLRRLLDTGLATVQNRIELFATEVREEKHRFVEVLLLLCMSMFLAVLALALVTFTIAYFVSEEARKYVLLGFSIFYLAAAIASFWYLQRRIRSTPQPFNDTIGEIKKDREWFRENK